MLTVMKELMIKNSVPNSRNARMQIGFAFLGASVSLGFQLPLFQECNFYVQECIMNDCHE